MQFRNPPGVQAPPNTGKVERHIPRGTPPFLAAEILPETKDLGLCVSCQRAKVLSSQMSIDWKPFKNNGYTWQHTRTRFLRVITHTHTHTHTRTSTYTQKKRIHHAEREVERKRQIRNEKTKALTEGLTREEI